MLFQLVQASHSEGAAQVQVQNPKREYVKSK